MTEEEKQKIKEEEIFRSTIREDEKKKRPPKKEKPPKTKGQKMMQFLNSPFGLFVLSSIVLAGITAAYNWNTNRIENNSRIENTSRKIKIELVQRFDILVEGLTFTDSIVPIDTSFMREMYLNNSAQSAYHIYRNAMFDEYANRTNLSLFYELLEHAETLEEKSAANAMIQVCKKLPGSLGEVYSKMDVNGYSTRYYIRLKREEILDEELIQVFNRWKKIAFPDA